MPARSMIIKQFGMGLMLQMFIIHLQNGSLSREGNHIRQNHRLVYLL